MIGLVGSNEGVATAVLDVLVVEREVVEEVVDMTDEILENEVVVEVEDDEEEYEV